MRRARLALVTAALLVLVACEGRISDPAGDGQGVDVVEAGIDYRTATTRLWIRFTEPASGVQQVWHISTDGDTTPEVVVRLGESGAGTGGGGEHYSVTRLDPSTGSQSVTCAGFSPNEGQVIELVVDSRCLGEPLPGSLRFTASSGAHRVAFDDISAWSDPIARS